MFTKTFFRFFAGFLVMIVIAFGVMLFTSSQIQNQPNPVDNVAVPQ